MKTGAPILLVEDDVVDVKTVRRAFSENGIANPLHVVGNGEEALQFLRNEGDYADKEQAPTPGIILLDLNMPVMGGLEFLKVVKEDVKFRRIPVIVLTTSKEDSDMIQSYNLSVAGYIVKPVEFEKFIEVVRTIKHYWNICELSRIR